VVGPPTKVVGGVGRGPIGRTDSDVVETPIVTDPGGCGSVGPGTGGTVEPCVGGTDGALDWQAPTHTVDATSEANAIAANDCLVAKRDPLPTCIRHLDSRRANESIDIATIAARPREYRTT
jgi:hypothetical protein